MVTFALLGAGRIGTMHAGLLSAHPGARLAWVHDVRKEAAREVAAANGAEPAPDIETVLGDDAVDAVLIASSTDTHVDLMTAAAKAGKAILCEKPIDLDIERVDRCWAEIAGCGVPVQIGFNRRYDPSHRAVRDAARAGEVGRIEQVIISSRDPGPPPHEYVKVSGGLFRDMTIHDFDLARFMLDEEPVEVSAMATAMIDPSLEKLGDIDSAMVTMKTASGALCHINNSRRSVYGYDQRIEVFGEKGMVRSNNRRATTVTRYTAAATAAQDRIQHFFIERYLEAYRAEIGDFVEAVEKGRETSVTFEDGRRALMLADAAFEALRTGRTVRVEG